MSDILLIALQEPQEIINSLKITRSLKGHDPLTNISMLSYEDAAPMLREHKDIERVYTIDRKKILSITSSGLFSDAFAINEFMIPIEKIKQKMWDHIVNISSNDISTPLTSYLKNQGHIGTCLNLDKSPSYSNYWAIVYNDILSGPLNIGLSYLENLHQMIGVEYITARKSVGRTPNNTSENQLTKIQNAKSITSLYLLGIFIDSSTIAEKINFENFYHFLELCLQSQIFHPVLFISPSETERTFAGKLKKENLKGQESKTLEMSVLPIIEYDMKSATTFLPHLDLVITSNTTISEMGDLYNTPTVELAFPPTKLFTRSTTQENNIIIRPLHENEASLNASDLLKACFLLCKRETKDISFSKNVAVYKISHQNNRYEYIPLDGCFNISEEITRMVGKDLVYLYSNSNHNLLPKSYYQSFFSKKEIALWVDQEKVNLSNVSKALLNCIRSVNHIKSKKRP